MQQSRQTKKTFNVEIQLHDSRTSAESAILNNPIDGNYNKSVSAEKKEKRVRFSGRNHNRQISFVDEPVISDHLKFI